MERERGKRTELGGGKSGTGFDSEARKHRTLREMKNGVFRGRGFGGMARWERKKPFEISREIIWKNLVMSSNTHQGRT